MKPDWSTAPAWAQWLAMDDNGDWWWYELKPTASDGAWRESKGRGQLAGMFPDYDTTLERRP